MLEGINETVTKIGGQYNEFLGTLPDWLGDSMNVFLIFLVVLIYVIFVWNFYRFISRKDVIKLNLANLNGAGRPVLFRFLTGVLYLVEYFLILPLLIFFWFAVLAFFLLILTEGIELSILITIAVVLVAVIRATSYYNEGLSSDVAKMIPLTLLAFSFLSPGFFDLEKIILKASQLPELLDSIFLYLLFIIFLEIIMRLLDFVFSLFGINTGNSEEVKT